MFNKQLINGDTWVFMGRIYRIWYVTPMKVMKILRNFYAVVALLNQQYTMVLNFTKNEKP